MTKKLRIVFDGPPGPIGGKFVEVENERGESIRCGEWVQVGEYWILEIPCTIVEDLVDPSKIWTLPIVAAEAEAKQDGFDKGYAKGTRFVDELEAQIANLVIDKSTMEDKLRDTERVLFCISTGSGLPNRFGIEHHCAVGFSKVYRRTIPVLADKIANAVDGDVIIHTCEQMGEAEAEGEFVFTKAELLQAIENLQKEKKS